MINIPQLFLPLNLLRIIVIKSKYIFIYVCNLYVLFNHPTILFLPIKFYLWNRYTFKDKFHYFFREWIQNVVFKVNIIQRNNTMKYNGFMWLYLLFVIKFFNGCVSNGFMLFTDLFWRAIKAESSILAPANFNLKRST